MKRTAGFLKTDGRHIRIAEFAFSSMQTIAQFERAFIDLENIIETGLNKCFDASSFDDKQLYLTIRAAATLEQALGGISRRLWDDPFEWTLPEAFPSKESAISYLAELRDLRAATFSAFRSDDELLRMIPAPIEMRSIGDVLSNALETSSALIGSAFDQNK